VISASKDCTVKIWDFTVGRELRTFTGHTADVSKCCVTRDSKYVISCSYDKTIKIFDFKTLEEKYTLVGHTNWVLCCDLTPDGKQIISGSSDGTLKVWDFETGKMTKSIVVSENHVSACCITKDSRFVVAGCRNADIMIFSYPEMRLVGTIESPVLEDHLDEVCTSQNGRFIFSSVSGYSYYCGLMRGFDFNTGERLFLTDDVEGVSMTVHKNRVISFYSHGGIRVPKILELVQNNMRKMYF